MRDDDALQHNPGVSRKALQEVHQDLFGWCLSRCGFDRPVAEDLLQQTYMEVLSGRARFDNKSVLKTFLFGVAQNLARSRFRKIAVRLRLLNTYLPADDAVRSESFVEPADDNQQVWQAVQALPARQRDITELVFCRDMSIGEASRVMGVTIGTGRVHYDRAKKALATTLADLKDESL